jgi:hypothetical protein
MIDMGKEVYMLNPRVCTYNKEGDDGDVVVVVRKRFRFGRLRSSQLEVMNKLNGVQLSDDNIQLRVPTLLKDVGRFFIDMKNLSGLQTAVPVTGNEFYEYACLIAQQTGYLPTDPTKGNMYFHEETRVLTWVDCEHYVKVTENIQLSTAISRITEEINRRSML